jgi:hypothetical protein
MKSYYLDDINEALDSGVAEILIDYKDFKVVQFTLEDRFFLLEDEEDNTVVTELELVNKFDLNVYEDTNYEDLKKGKVENEVVKGFDISGEGASDNTYYYFKYRNLLS